MQFRHLYSDHMIVSDETATINEEPTLTQQSDAQEANINVIMERYQTSGQLPKMLQEGIYGDFSNVTDYRTAVETIRAAEDAFYEIPAQIRQKFDNNPDNFIKFATDPSNKQALQEMGLANADKKPTIEEETLKAIRDLKPKETDGNSK
ncbi:MAG: internal scaffolding protein [Arizlama microvirus]|nr:MAG: internal scaffolding protein [Arizlama microvirus]